MALLDLLQSLLTPQHGGAPMTMGQSQGAVAPGQATGPGAQANFPISELLAQSTQREQPLQANTVNPVTVRPSAPNAVSAPSASVGAAAQPPSAQGVAPGDQQLMSGVPGDPTIDNGAPQNSQNPQINYNNSGALGAVNSADAANAPDHGANGLYGILPKGLQHGTLRNILGHLGDAMLVTSGMQPTYEPYLERQAEGNALAGVDITNPASVQAAVSRLAATGAPGALEAADKLQQQAEQAALRQQYMQYNNTYRQQMIGTKYDNTFRLMAPAAIADLSRATNEDDYRAKLNALNLRVKAINPDTDAMTVFGAPLNYTPGFFDSQSGMTNQQTTQHEDRVAGRAQTQVNAMIAARSRVEAAGVNAGGGVQRANIEAHAQMNDSQIGMLRDIAPKIDDGTATQAEQDVWNRYMSTPRTATKPPAMVPHHAAGVPAAAPAGTKISAQDVLDLRANPHQAARFNAYFRQYGPNVAQRILGSQPGQLQP